MPAILHPLPDVAVHVVKSEGVGLKRTNGRRLLNVPLATTAVATSVAHTQIIAPGIASIGASSCRIFPFDLAEKSVIFSTQLREPADILFSVNPADVNHRHLPASPMIRDSRALGRGGAGIPF